MCVDSSAKSKRREEVKAASVSTNGATAKASLSRRGGFRLLACGCNVLMVIVMYIEYLWAAEFFDDSQTCAAPSGDLLEMLNCCRRYTFSDAMLRGRNLEVFMGIGSVVAAIYTKLEWDRVQRLRELVVSRRKLGVAPEDDWKPAVALRCLDLFLASIVSAFACVLLLVPFHLERPIMHYLVAGFCWTATFTAICLYAVVPLDFAAPAGNGAKAIKSTADDVAVDANAAALTAWAQRRQRLLPFLQALIAVQVVTVGVGILRVASPGDLTGRLFGAFEVLVILSYQGFVALFAWDDAAVAAGVAGAVAGAPASLKSGREGALREPLRAKAAAGAAVAR
eukprot:TRINITY_DN29367_c0_g2_i1.p1 TRINITY_DN29367_c0_g2~~TRINITY_DN29367_c0_g2_i1.p1  ORF type:complete len:338 (+),score=69.53 TRINITY_DN29367_c0_g2_i1:126-1139(+)